MSICVDGSVFLYVCRWRWVCENGLTESGDEVICVFGRVEVLSCKSNQVFGWVGVVG